MKGVIFSPLEDAEVRQHGLSAWDSLSEMAGLDGACSYLRYLQNLPFDTLKIDRSFIASMDDPKSCKIICAK